ncbi:aldo/keto reductase [Brucepastera parasyntrophica]|uniref:aldo/keto reductase n=1 Tax=Brucepastera parasyntrophica TaxID=2880008 RepID=UPI00210A8304|nr:aldo/keto reductase [Brucepastera parasyntrophica]ULQ59186.1 aldo/keto reductase [Brucepastera parasyntrophica]
MEKRHFKSIKEDLSLLGFGCMRLPVTDKSGQDIDRAAAEKMIDRAIENGVNYFDTAWTYHNGMSEIFIGEALKKYPREKFFLATKMPTWNAVQSTADAERIFSEQLKKCGVDYFDFYLAHALTAEHFANFEKYEVYELLDRKKKEGKIRHLGFSFHDTPDVLRDIISSHTWDFVQLQINYFDWETNGAKEQYEIAEKNSLPVIVMEPVRGGSLASLNEKASAILREADPGKSAASWAVRFAASLPNVLTVLSGMSTMEQVDDNLKTMNDFRPLNGDEYETIKIALSAFRTADMVPCTGCRYCMDCPFGVDIPGNFSIFNEFCGSRNREAFDTAMKNLGESAQPDKCTRCGTCVELCPQKINIPDELEKISSLVHGGR